LMQNQLDRLIFDLPKYKVQLSFPIAKVRRVLYLTPRPDLPDRRSENLPQPKHNAKILRFRLNSTFYGTDVTF
jgi:hypothetical protein